MAEYRILCSEGVEFDRFEGGRALGWAVLAAKSADACHDGCTTPHRVQRCLGWDDVPADVQQEAVR